MREMSSIHNHDCLSFADAVCSPEDLVKASKDKGLKSFAITNHGHAHSTARIHLEAKKQGVRALLGLEAYVIDSLGEWNKLREQLALERKTAAEETEFDVDRAAEDKAKRKVLYRKGHLVLIAQNRTGLANLYRLQFQSHKRGFFQKPRMDLEMLAEHSEGLLASSACMGGVISARYSLFKRGECEWAEVVQLARRYHGIFGGRFFLELQSNEVGYQKELNAALIQIHGETGIPLIVTQDAHYTDPEDWRAQQILHMLLTHRGNNQQGLTFGKLPDTYKFEARSLYVKSADELWDQFREWNPEVEERLLAQAFDNTLLADSMVEQFEPDTAMRLPSLPYEDTFKELMRSSAEGLISRGLAKDDRYMERLKYELGVIKEKGLANYFLVVRNICDAARKEMRIGPGRGSAAGSLICYLTGITNIDPIEHKLMFERFINLDRVETPDIDLDFQDVDRVKDILRRDFGEDNVACISTYGTSQIKGLLKDVCRVHGIDHNECNRANAQIEKEMKALYKEEEGVTRSAITIKLDDVYRLSPTFRGLIARYPEIEPAVKSLYGKEHHVGRHASGVVIGDDLPAETSLFTSRGVVQASFTDGIVNKSASNMGLVKFDILGLATLEVIARTIRNVAARTGRSEAEIDAEIDPKRMDFNDISILKKVFWEGNTCGIFSVTSAGMQKLFMRVKPTSFDDVAAVCALYRPGPLGSGMDGLFADRKNGIEEVTYDHPILEDIMRDTYGCLVYQEQMLEIGRRLGQMNWKDTNRLRKLFLKKDKSKQDDFIKREEEELKAKLIAGVVANGLSAEKGEELWEMCGKFGGYGFNRAHSYAYGMVTMQTAYLRCRYPLEFFSALLTVGQADELQSYVNDIRRQGFKILPVDVNRSGASHLMEGDAIRLSLLSVKGVGNAAVTKILANQPYTGLIDFLTRSGSTKTATLPLIRVGALSELEPTLPTATVLKRAELWYSEARVRAVKNRDGLPAAFEALGDHPDDPVELMQAERELLGFNLRGTPFSIRDRERKVDALRSGGMLTHASLRELFEDEDAQQAIVPLVVKSLKEKPQRNGKMFAFLSLADREGTGTETVAFGNIWEHVRAQVRPGDVYLCTVHRKDGEPTSLVVGYPGWKITPQQAAMTMLPIDQITI